MAKQKRKTSLLNPEAMGGDIAGSGLTFQDQVLLSLIPRWLADERFTLLISEALGDIEASFFVPSAPFAKALFEVKNHSVAPAEFKDELRRFRELDAESPGTYHHFALVSPGISATLAPLVNGLRRLRKAIPFYADDQPIRDSSYADFVELVHDLGQTMDDARFLLEKVEFVQMTQTQIGGEGHFFEHLSTALPEYRILAFPIVQQIYRALGRVLQEQKAMPITRRVLESAITDAIPVDQRPVPRPITIHTAFDDHEPVPARALTLDWIRFWGGSSRSYPPAAEWTTQLVGELQSVLRWVKYDRGIPHILLTGQRRLSAAIAIGSVFSAVSQVVIDVDHRNQRWSTNDYARPGDSPYELHTQLIGDQGDHLVVSVGVVRVIAAEVDQALDALGLADQPRLHLAGGAVASSADANAAAAACKHAIVTALGRTGARQIDLFFAGPVHIAIFLGHRLNAMAPIQCYEWVATNRYIRTCLLPSG